MRFYRAVLYALVVGAVFAGALRFGHTLLDAHEVEPPATRLRVASVFRERVARIRGLDLPAETRRVVFLGDSMEADFPPLQKIPVTLQREINRRGAAAPSIRIFDLAIVGTGIFDYLCMADVLAEARPHLVVLPFNLSNPSRHWQRSFSRPELAGWIGPGRLLDSLRLPLRWAGVTTDRLLFYTSIVHAGGAERWGRRMAEQLRYAEARRMLEAEVSGRDAGGESPEETFENVRYLLDRKRHVVAGTRRLTAPGARHYFGPALDGLSSDAPTLRLLGGAVRALRARGIEVLVYVDPLNVEHLQRLGVLDAQRMERTIESVRETVGEGGGYFLDLHALFPDGFFRDEIGHLTFDRERDGPARFAKELAPSVIELAGVHAL